MLADKSLKYYYELYFLLKPDTSLIQERQLHLRSITSNADPNKPLLMLVILIESQLFRFCIAQMEFNKICIVSPFWKDHLMLKTLPQTRFVGHIGNCGYNVLDVNATAISE